jgi:hypothetical protein
MTLESRSAVPLRGLHIVLDAIAVAVEGAQGELSVR